MKASSSVAFMGTMTPEDREWEKNSHLFLKLRSQKEQHKSLENSNIPTIRKTSTSSFENTIIPEMNVTEGEIESAIEFLIGH